MKETYKPQTFIDESSRKVIAEGLNQIVANLSDLSLQVKQSHWNITGEDYFFLHNMFDSIYKEIVDYTDAVAERIVQLKIAVKGSINNITKISQLVDIDRYISQQIKVNEEKKQVDIKNIDTTIAKAEARLRAYLEGKELDSATETVDKNEGEDIGNNQKENCCLYLKIIAINMGITINSVRGLGDKLKAGNLDSVTENQVWDLAGKLEKQLMFIEGNLIKSLENI